MTFYNLLDNQPVLVDADGVILTRDASASGLEPPITADSINPFSLDAFAAMRVSFPFTIFDSKQIVDNLPLFWDDQETSGSDTTSTYTRAIASTVLGVANETAGVRYRQTFRRFNYQPGKSQRWFFTGVVGAPTTGIDRYFGPIDDNDGFAFGSDENGLYFLIRSSVTGSPVDTKVYQSAWKVDKLDGTGKSGLTLNPATQVLFTIDAEWLGVGIVRFGFFANGRPVYADYFNAQTTLITPYMQNINLPLRYYISNDGSGPAATITQTCSSVSSEGGQEQTGIGRSAGLLDYGVTSQSILGDGEWYPIMSFRLKSTHLAISIQPVRIGFLSADSNVQFELALLFNPSVGGTDNVSWQAKSNSALEVDVTRDTTNPLTVTATTVITNRTLSSNTNQFRPSTNKDNVSALQLGAAIDNTPDEIVLAARSIVGGAFDIYAFLEWQAGL